MFPHSVIPRSTRRSIPGIGAALLAIQLISLIACKDHSASRANANARTPAPTGEQEPFDAAVRSRGPRSQAELATTDPDIAVRNFSAQLAAFERVLERSPDVQMLAKLASMHVVRAQFLSTISDYARAMELADRAVHDFPASGLAYLTRARARAALHKFDDAIQDLERAEHLGLTGDPIAEVRASIDEARSLFEAAQTLRRSMKGDTDIHVMGGDAALAGEMGDLSQAEQLFERAQDLARDVSPFPLAWLYFQEGLMWQRSGDTERATTYFEAAHDRLPQYAPVTSHLASMLAGSNQVERAIRLLRPLAETSEDPEYAGQLAALLDRIGTSSATAPLCLPPEHRGTSVLEAPLETDRLIARAGARYDELMRRYPEAFGDHAARFWLGVGRSPEKALVAAEVNLDVRRTEEGYELALKSALAAHDGAKACAIADRARAESRPMAALTPLLELADDACVHRAHTPPAPLHSTGADAGR